MRGPTRRSRRRRGRAGRACRVTRARGRARGRARREPVGAGARTPIRVRSSVWAARRSRSAAIAATSGAEMAARVGGRGLRRRRGAARCARGRRADVPVGPHRRRGTRSSGDGGAIGAARRSTPAMVTTRNQTEDHGLELDDRAGSRWGRRRARYRWRSRSRSRRSTTGAATIRLRRSRRSRPRSPVRPRCDVVLAPQRRRAATPTTRSRAIAWARRPRGSRTGPARRVP